MDVTYPKIDSELEPKDISEALHAGANYIEEYGWMKIDPIYSDDGRNCACAVTSLCKVVPYNTELRVEAIEALADVVVPRWRNLPNDARDEHGLLINQAGTLVGYWNDAQPNKEIVINKMREVADKHDY